MLTCMLIQARPAPAAKTICFASEHIIRQEEANPMIINHVTCSQSVSNSYYCNYLIANCRSTGNIIHNNMYVEVLKC